MTEGVMRALPIRATAMNTKGKLETARSYLESYLIFSKMLDLRKCEEDAASDEDAEKKRAALAYEIVCIKTRMREIEDFIDGLQIDGKWFECKIILRYHYILGYTVEECAEKMYVSRSTAYRLKKKALRIASEQIIS